MANEKNEGSVTAFCDGGSRGNPGPAGYGVFIEGANGAPLAELSEFIGVKTNNVAEYSGLLAALGWALEHGVSELLVVSDSELMVKQIKGQYSVKSPDLKPLYEEAKKRAAQLSRFKMQHVLRGKNKEADRLANQAMDRGTGRGTGRGLDRNGGPVADRPNSRGTDRSTSRAPAKTAQASLPTAIQSARVSAAPSATQLPPTGNSVQRPAATTEPGPVRQELPTEVTGFVRNGVVHLVEGELPEGTFVRVLPARQR